jgi:hypothetical protein
MSLPTDDNVLELHNLPSTRFCRQYMNSQPELSSRGGLKEFAKNVEDDTYEELDADNPHEPFEAKKVTLDINVSMQYDPSSKKFELKLLEEDIKNFMHTTNKRNVGKNLSKCVITSVILNGISGISDNRWDLKIIDGAQKSIQKVIGNRQGYKSLKNGFKIIGFPIPNHSVLKPTVLLEAQNEIDPVIKRYGNFNMNLITENVFEFKDKLRPQMMVPLYPNSLYFYYVLVTKNKIMQNLSLGTKYDDNYIRLPVDVYHMVVNAYEKKIREIESKMHNLSSLEIILTPLCDNVVVRDYEEVFLSITIDCFMPEK